MGSGLNAIVTKPVLVVLVEFRYQIRNLVNRYRLYAVAGVDNHGKVGMPGFTGYVPAKLKASVLD